MMTASELRKKYDDAVLERGERYIRNVKSCIKIKNVLHAKVQGSYMYYTKLNLDTLEGDCSCPYNYNCKHAVAIYIYYKKVKSINADEFLKELNNFNKAELIKIIEKIIPERPDLIQKATFRKKTDYEGWVNDFIENFSVNELENIEENVDRLSFEQILRILDYVENNEDSINESLAEDYDSYESYDDEGDILFDFAYKLQEEIIDRTKSKEQLIIILKKRYMNELICDNAEIFFKYKEIVKNYLTQEEYLKFLLNCKNPDLEEIKKYLNEDNEPRIYFTIRNNISLVERLAEYLNNNNLKFLVAYHKEDSINIIKYFECFSNLKKFYMVQPEHIVTILAKSKTIPKNIAQVLFQKQEFTSYSEMNLKFLLKNLNDAKFICDNTLFDAKFSMIKEVVKRLEELQYDISAVFLKKDFLLRRHWTEIVEILKYVRQTFGVNFLDKFIRFHEKQFISSSTLKNNLKQDGIIIQYIKGELRLEIK